jgi:hypothetical protein
MNGFVPKGHTPIQAVVERFDVSAPDLRQHLFVGDLPCYLLPESGGSLFEMKKIGFWGGRAAVRAFKTGDAFEAIPLGSTNGKAFIKNREIENVLAGLPARPLTGERHKEHGPPPNPGGAPRKYDWEAFLIQAFKLIYEGGPIPAQAKLIELTLDWYEANVKGPVPDLEQCKPKIRRFYKHLGIRAER